MLDCHSCFYCFWMHAFPWLATNPLINSSPTSGLALAVGREASFISDLSSAVAKPFRFFHRMLTVSQVGPTPMFRCSPCLVPYSPSPRLGFCVYCGQNVSVCTDEISRGPDISGNCSLAIVMFAFGLGHLAQTKVLTFIFKRKQMHRRFVS